MTRADHTHAQCTGGAYSGLFQPDGWAQTRIGVFTPHADVVPETEFGALAPEGISIHAMRVPFGAYKAGGTMDRTIADDPVRAFAEPPLVDDAAELLGAAPLPQSVNPFAEFSGRINAVDYAEIRPQVSGRITDIRFRDGEHVKVGDVLFVIDPRPYRAAVDKAQADLATAIN